jgi:hypothetical protein
MSELPAKKRESETNLSYLSTLDDWVATYIDAPSASLNKVPSTPSSSSGCSLFEDNEEVVLLPNHHGNL